MTDQQPEEAVAIEVGDTFPMGEPLSQDSYELSLSQSSEPQVPQNSEEMESSTEPSEAVRRAPSRPAARSRRTMDDSYDDEVTNMPAKPARARSRKGRSAARGRARSGSRSGSRKRAMSKPPTPRKRRAASRGHGRR